MSLHDWVTGTSETSDEGEDLTELPIANELLASILRSSELISWRRRYFYIKSLLDTLYIDAVVKADKDGTDSVKIIASSMLRTVGNETLTAESHVYTLNRGHSPMLKLPEDILDKALATLVEGIPGLDYESQPTPLTQLSQKEEALKFVQHAFYSHVQKRMLPIHRQINQLLPIYKLPDELLQQIFLGACELEYAVSRYRSSTRLAAVSRRWRSVATSYARLWNFLHSETNLEAIKLMLQRCTSAPLDLFCSCLSRPKARAFFDLLTPLSTRWRSLKFNYDNVDRLSLDFLTGQSLPLLEHLTLPTIGYELRDRALSNRNLGIIAPSLRELEAHRHPLPLRLDH
ncbi:hypothetical protein FRC03_012006, partial [Tulasnella sp. 419]